MDFFNDIIVLHIMQYFLWRYFIAADYPDWVLAHKNIGTYINKVGDKYYLYAAHSERIKGSGKVKYVCDGYLGRITKDDGFIPSKSKPQKCSGSF